jgi:hypothetical protein
MTLYVGSGSGASDLGMCRAKSWDGTGITIGRASDVQFTNGCWLTVVDDFGFWDRLPTLNLTSIQMDDNINYTDQHVNFDPVVIMGPDIAIPSTSGSIAVSGSASYCFDSSITGYSWSCTSGSISGSGANITYFPAYGWNRLNLTVTAANGKTFTGRRTVTMYNDSDLITGLNVNSMAGDASNGGWMAEVELWDGAALPTVRSRMKMFLIADDYYAGTHISMGQVPGQEQVLLLGWISGETIKYQSDRSSVTFQLQTSHYWIQNIPGPSGYLEAVPSGASVWTSINSLNIDRAAWHFFHWRSTVDAIIDVFPSNNTRLIGGMAFSIDSIWNQIFDTLSSRMSGEMKCNRYSQLFIEQDPNLELDRSSTVQVETLTNDDFGEEVDITVVSTSPYAMVEVAAAQGYDTAANLCMARAPGSLVYKRFGTSKTYDQNIVSDQADCNVLTGMLLAQLNNVYPEIDVKLAQNNRMVDIAPCMWLGFNTSGSQNARNLTLSIRMIANHIEYIFRPETGSVTTDLTCVAETSGSPGVMVTQPDSPIYNFSDTSTGISGSSAYTLTPFTLAPMLTSIPSLLNRDTTVPGTSTSGSVACPLTSPQTGPYNTYLSGTFLSSSRARILVQLPSFVRTASHLNPTTWSLTGNFSQLNASGSYVPVSSYNWFTVYACDANMNRIVTGTGNSFAGSSGSASTITGNLIASGSTAVYARYFEIVINPDSFTPTNVTSAWGGAGGQASLGTLTWGLTPTGLWIHNAGAAGSPGSFGFPNVARIRFRISASPANYQNQWFTASCIESSHMTYISGINYGGEFALQDNEVGYDANYHITSDEITELGWDDGHHARIANLPPRNIVNGNYNPVSSSPASFQNTPFYQINYPSGSGADLLDLCVMNKGGGVAANAYYVYTIDSLDMLITFMATYQMVIQSFTISNVCPAGG